MLRLALAWLCSCLCGPALVAVLCELDLLSVGIGGVAPLRVQLVDPPYVHRRLCRGAPVPPGAWLRGTSARSLGYCY